jgi:hypothetical protein
MSCRGSTCYVIKRRERKKSQDTRNIYLSVGNKLRVVSNLYLTKNGQIVEIKQSHNLARLSNVVEKLVQPVSLSSSLSLSLSKMANAADPVVYLAGLYLDSGTTAYLSRVAICSWSPEMYPSSV